MACYDCEDCKHSENEGGLCTHFEYDCIFSHLPTKESSPEKKQSFDSAKEMLKALETIFNKHSKDFDTFAEEYQIPQLKEIITKLKALTDDKLVKEYYDILKGEESNGRN